MSDTYRVVLTQMYKKTWLLRSHIIEDTLADAEARINREIAFNRSHGYGTEWRVTRNDTEVMSGKVTA
jgi:hypothetical protein